MYMIKLQEFHYLFDRQLTEKKTQTKTTCQSTKQDIQTNICIFNSTEAVYENLILGNT